MSLTQPYTFEKPACRYTGRAFPYSADWSRAVTAELYALA